MSLGTELKLGLSVGVKLGTELSVGVALGASLGADVKDGNALGAELKLGNELGLVVGVLVVGLVGHGVGWNSPGLIGLPVGTLCDGEHIRCAVILNLSIPALSF